MYTQSLIFTFLTILSSFLFLFKRFARLNLNLYFILYIIIIPQFHEHLHDFGYYFYIPLSFPDGPGTLTLVNHLGTHEHLLTVDGIEMNECVVRNSFLDHVGLNYSTGRTVEGVHESIAKLEVV